MTKRHNKNLIAGVDIGTSKVVTMIGEIGYDGNITIIGIGSHPSKGLRKGVVVDIEKTVHSIKKSAEEAELMAGCNMRSVYTGIAGSHIRSLNSHGIVAIRDSEVSAIDVDRVIEAAKAVAIPADQKILHILPQEYIIDNQEGIKEPIGMCGVRLETRVHMVSGAVSAAQNIVKCVRKCGFNVTDVILEQLASSYAVLTEDEKDLGVCLVDIGGGTTDIAVFTNGAIRYTAVIPIAGDQVTNDIAVALRTPTQAAEKIKKKYASALVSNSSEDMIKIPSVSNIPGRAISKRDLSEVVEARYEELFQLIKKELHKSGCDKLIPAGIVLTGGASKIDGGLILAERVFKIPVHKGVPQHVKGLKEVINNPIYATGVGLLIYGHQQNLNAGTVNPFMKLGVKGMWGRMRKWFNNNF